MPLRSFCRNASVLLFRFADAEVADSSYGTARPKFSDVIFDTKVLLQQSREKLVITYVGEAYSS